MPFEDADRPSCRRVPHAHHAVKAGAGEDASIAHCHAADGAGVPEKMTDRAIVGVVPDTHARLWTSAGNNATVRTKRDTSHAAEMALQLHHLESSARLP
jgi:hypothetical protein